MPNDLFERAEAGDTNAMDTLINWSLMKYTEDVNEKRNAA